MNEMLSSLGFNRVTNTKWVNGSTMMVLVNPVNLDLVCLGSVNNAVEIEYSVPCTDLETMKHQVEKFMRMVGKCIQVDEE
ncbi:hypothetical protein [Flyfo podovirus Tbat2_2]|nr:hypothetical protein [Flyfo podovirus Tbat2_2]